MASDVPKGSWTDIWREKGVFVEWREECRKYIGLCQHYACQGRHSGVIIC